MRWPAPCSEPAAFAGFYEAEAPRLLIFFARRTCDPHAALDLCAETFAEAFAGRRRFRGDTDDEARAWLYGIAQHRLSRFFRRGATERRALARLGMQVPELTVDDFEQIEREADLAGVRDRVRAGLEDLSDDHREALRAARGRGVARTKRSRASSASPSPPPARGCRAACGRSVACSATKEAWHERPPVPRPRRVGHRARRAIARRTAPARASGAGVRADAARELCLAGVTATASYLLTGSPIPGAHARDVPDEATPLRETARLMGLDAPDPGRWAAVGRARVAQPHRPAVHRGRPGLGRPSRHRRARRPLPRAASARATTPAARRRRWSARGCSTRRAARTCAPW